MDITTLSQYTDYIRSRGQRSFTREEAQKAIQASDASLTQALHRLLQKGVIARPVRGFYIMVPPQDRFVGCIPQHELLPLLMHHLKLSYYVGVLSAAKYYGASHQKPFEVQVVTNRQLTKIACGKVRVTFIYKKNVDNIPIRKFDSPTGDIHVSTPEATAMDLINYSKHAVGINNIATVLSELIEEIKIPQLLQMAKISGQNAWVQRMGYILERVNSIVERKRQSIVSALQRYLSSKKTSYVPLSSTEPRRGTHNTKWKIIANTTVESDL